MKTFQIADFKSISKEYVSTAQDDTVHAEVKLVSQLGTSYVDILSIGKAGGGRLGTHQQERAKALRDELLQQVTDTVKAAGWNVSDSLGFTSYRRNGHMQDSVTHPRAIQEERPNGNAIKQVTVTHERAKQEEMPKEDKQITVGTYTRIVSPKSITFVCARCGQTVTQQRYPSPKPMYCRDECRKEAEKEQTRLRVERSRAARKQATKKGVTANVTPVLSVLLQLAIPNRASSSGRIVESLFEWHLSGVHFTIPLAAINILEILQNALLIMGYPAVFLFVMIESSGIPFPGETMLLLAAFYSALDHHLQLPFVIACAALGAIVGDNIGFYVGRTGGKALVERYGHFVFLKPEHLERAEKFFARYGDKTVFFGRFVAVLRAWAAFLAGVNQMRWRTFLIYNAAGGILWATIFGLLGFFAGRFFHDNFTQVELLARNISWIMGGSIVIATLTIAVIIYRRRKANQAAQNEKSSN